MKSGELTTGCSSITAICIQNVVIISEGELAVEYIEEQEETGRQEASNQSRSERVDVGTGYYCLASGIYNNGRARRGRKRIEPLRVNLDPDRR